MVAGPRHELPVSRGSYARRLLLDRAAGVSAPVKRVQSGAVVARELVVEREEAMEAERIRDASTLGSERNREDAKNFDDMVWKAPPLAVRSFAAFMELTGTNLAASMRAGVTVVERAMEAGLQGRADISAPFRYLSGTRRRAE